MDISFKVDWFPVISLFLMKVDSLTATGQKTIQG
jgi:hypothetical protein